MGNVHPMIHGMCGRSAHDLTAAKRLGQRFRGMAQEGCSDSLGHGGRQMRANVRVLPRRMRGVAS